MHVWAWIILEFLWSRKAHFQIRARNTWQACLKHAVRFLDIACIYKPQKNTFYLLFCLSINGQLHWERLEETPATFWRTNLGAARSPRCGTTFYSDYFNFFPGWKQRESPEKWQQLLFKQQSSISKPSLSQRGRVIQMPLGLSSVFTESPLTWIQICAWPDISSPQRKDLKSFIWAW